MMYLPRTKAVVCSLFGFALLLFSSPLHSQPYTFNTFIGSATDAGSADGTNSSAQFISPTGLTMDSAGTLYVADGNAIRSITAFGTNRVVRTIAGSVGSHAFIDGTNAAARLNAPQGVAVDAGGTLYVADTFNNAIRKVAPLGTNWVVTTIAGPNPPSTQFGTADGTNNGARFHNPYGIAVDAATNLYIADSLNQTIRRITPSGTNWIVTTIAGAPLSSGAVNGSNNVARFTSPSALALDTNGVIFVTDFGNNAVRKITHFGTNWAVTTIAGSLASPGSADGTGSAALFHFPQCVAIDPAQNLFVTDSANYTIRKITPGGVVTTVAGSPGSPGSADGTGSATQFKQPFGIAADASGLVYVADYLGYAIRQGQLAPVLQWNLSGTSLVLSWPAGLAGFALESSTNVPGLWTPVPTNNIVLSGEYLCLTNSADFGSSFFRLHKSGL